MEPALSHSHPAWPAETLPTGQAGRRLGRCGSPIAFTPRPHTLPDVFNVPSALKRLVIGKAMRSEELGETLLPKRLALPIFASDPLSSVAYATEEILLVLTVGGTAFLYLTPWVALGVVALMAVVVLSYRQVVHAYPGGGGSYEVVTRNLGAKAGLVVAASLMVDYVMTVAVSVASGVDNIISAFPGLGDYRVVMACSFVALLAAMNLRGVRESGKAFAAPTYMFIFGILLMVATGFIKMAFGHAPVAESAKYAIIPTDHNGTLAGVALIMLGLKAFASGCTALTGVEAISNGVPPSGPRSPRTPPPRCPGWASPPW